IFRYHIKEYKNGLLFKINNLEDMFLKIVEGLKMNWNRDEISKNAQIKYNWEKQAVKLLEVYKKIRTGDNNS
ncbi:MAG: glycosyltransferase, partial [Candidatus Helarchaeota archaeon]